VNICHVAFAGAHIGADDVIADIAQSAREGTNDLLLALSRHPGIGNDDRLRSTMRQAGRCVLHRHCAGQAKAFFERGVGGHPASADGRAGRDIIDDNYCTQVQLWLVDSEHLFRSEIIGELK
jgi:hypothetical protein